MKRIFVLVLFFFFIAFVSELEDYKNKCQEEHGCIGYGGGIKNAL